MADTLSEHLEYLSLPGRTRLYEQAISEIISPGDTVADLGCGVGVLGLVCLEAGAGEVWGIDHSEAIHLARETMERAALSSQYHCISGSTFQTELPKRVDVLICDHVGFFGFDYGIIEMLADARLRFLKPGGVVIPRSLDLFVAAASSSQCLTLAGAWSAADVPSSLHWLEDYQRNTRHAVDFTEDDLISAPVGIGQISFNAENPELFAFTATLEIEHAAELHGLAGWFSSALSDDVRMTNSPIEPTSIKRRQAFLPAREPFTVKKGDCIDVSLKFRRDGSMITWTIEPPGQAPKQKLSTWNSRILDPQDVSEVPQAPLQLSELGQARSFILSQVDGSRNADEIVESVLTHMPDIFPTQQAVRQFVSSVLRSNSRST